MENSKLETLNSKQITNIKLQNTKIYDLGERTGRFAKRAFIFADNLPKSLSNIEIGKQLIRSAGSVGANYIEGEESLSRKDFVCRIKISKKEAKETQYWLKLTEPREEYIQERELLIKEAGELTKIFGSIVEKSK